MRISRTKAYALTQEWRASGGRSGLPVIDLGDTLRIPRRALERMLGVELTGPLPMRQAGRTPGPKGSRKEEAAPRRLGVPDAPNGGVAAAGGSNVTPMRRKRRRGSDQAPLFESPAGPGAEHQ